MPIYEYVCSGCQHRFEVKQKLSDAPVAACVRCGEAVTKVISAPAIMFKGSGWYVTDYSDKMKPPTQSESAGKPTNGQAETAKKDAGTAAPSPAPAQAGTSSDTGGGTTAPSTGTATPAAFSTPSTSSTSPSSSQN
ncbi:MAG: zinc ribbon domain-containing protein [Nitrospira sp.]|nr:zinc ribbon domain-containing protein [Nitrospira sp.]